MKKIYCCFIIIFVVVVSAPFWGMSFYEVEPQEEEKSSVDLFPLTISKAKAFIFKIEESVQKEYAFQRELTDVYLNFFLKVLKEDPIPEDVIIGKDGWFFLGDKYVDSYTSSLGLVPVKEEEVKGVCREIHKLKKMCDSHNIGFYFSVAPNKGTVYNKYLPLDSRPKKVGAFKDSVISSLKKDYDVNAIDLGEYIYPMRDKIKLYYKTDSHWNDYGGFLAVKKLTDQISVNYDVDSLSKDDYLLITSIFDRGDLTQMLKMKVPEDDFSFEPKSTSDIEQEVLSECEINSVMTYNKDSKSTVNAIVFKDSFFRAMMDPFSRSIRKGIFVDRADITKEIISEYIEIMEDKPDFIVIEIVERNLKNFLD